MKPSAAAVPVFTLYGGELSWPTPDLLHCESIAERSRLHDWEIRPHRHGDLAQLLYLRRGVARMEIEGRQIAVEQAAVQVIPPLTIHGFRFSTDVDGYIVTLAAPLLANLQAHLGTQQAVLAQPGLYLLGDDELRHVDALFQAIAEEYASAAAPGRDLLLQSLIAALAVWLSRRLAAPPSSERGLGGPRQGGPRTGDRRPGGPRGERAGEYLAHFTQLLEAHFREHWAVEEYARRLDISTAHLNGICRRLHGHSALGLLHQRLLLEAKRNLIYTSLTVNQIAELLGFSEPAYFTRFFKRLTDTTPGAFRRGEGRP
ncbi:helix-turn-helix domain-containing protein [Pseudomonas sp. GCM10022188]|uniref:helix-turn-helix domain-containing protein n=1 Tax=Pseudomonas TaxID=286 RepID=UPI001E4C71DE|nr:helix-turn-helix domain-containing protein [Pseudomonas oryzagri]MCC6075259.1 helix-turn-helix domain-containing protein [Pseudomonas oryzagri]